MKTKDNHEVCVNRITMQSTYDDIAVGVFQEVLYKTINKIYRFYTEFKKRQHRLDDNWPDYWPRIYLALPDHKLLNLHQYDEDWGKLSDDLA